MTTTTHPKITLIIGLRDKARNAAATAAEATTYLEKARALCVKYDIDPSILTEATKQTTKSFINGQAPQEKKFPCRFGCNFAMHTIDELNACAEKARNANGGNAYANAKSGPKTDPFDAWFRDFTRNAGGHHTYDEPKARRNGSHANCSHEATKAARARCRKDREAYGY